MTGTVKSNPVSSENVEAKATAITAITVTSITSISSITSTTSTTSTTRTVASCTPPKRSCTTRMA